MHEIFTHLIYELQEGRDCQLVTITGHQGSAPRGRGAQMLMGAQRRIAGTIGGGSIEYDAEGLAKELLARREGGFKTYALHTDVKENIGMVCGGDVSVHFQYVPACGESLAFVKQVLDAISAHEHRYLNLFRNGPLTLTEAPDPAGYPMPLPQGERAVIFGAGHCGQALAGLLDQVGFQVTVMDNRAQLLTRELFPRAKTLICGDLEHIERYITIVPEDYVVIMTNAHTFDFVLQEQLLKSPLAYIGVIGSRSKKAAVEERLREAGIREEMIRTVHTPIGLPIGAVTPEEIAVSIAAEMIRVRADKRKAGDGTACPMHTSGA